MAIRRVDDNFVIQNNTNEEFLLNVRNTLSHSAFFSMLLEPGDIVTVLKDDKSYLTVVNTKVLEIAHAGFTTKDKQLIITSEWWNKKKMPIGHIDQ